MPKTFQIRKGKLVGPLLEGSPAKTIDDLLDRLDEMYMYYIWASADADRLEEELYDEVMEYMIHV